MVRDGEVLGEGLLQSSPFPVAISASVQCSQAPICSPPGIQGSMVVQLCPWLVRMFVSFRAEAPESPHGHGSSATCSHPAVNRLQS